MSKSVKIIKRNWCGEIDEDFFGFLQSKKSNFNKKSHNFYKQFFMFYIETWLLSRQIIKFAHKNPMLEAPRENSVTWDCKRRSRNGLMSSKKNIELDCRLRNFCCRRIKWICPSSRSLMGIQIVRVFSIKHLRWKRVKIRFTVKDVWASIYRGEKIMK